MKRLLCLLLVLGMTAFMTACSTENVSKTIETDAPLISESEPEKSKPTVEISIIESSDVSEEPTEPEEEAKPSSSSSSSEKTTEKDKNSSSSSSSESSQSETTTSSQETSEPPVVVSTPVTGETKAVWISYLEYQSILQGQSKSQFSANVETMFSNLAGDGFNTVYVHARSHSDAMYDSAYFPWSVYCSGTEGKSPGFDPLAVMVTKAHNAGLKIEAWVNPYRVKGTTDTAKISAGSPAYDWLGTGKVVIVEGSGIYYNPADEDVIDLVVSGVEEIVRNYDVDGIHFDDYFYPTTAESFDDTYYKNYTRSGGKLSLSAWRRQNVNTLIERVYSSIKSIDPACRFGISPTGNMESNYGSLYCDVATWVTNPGYIDYICPQIYYGFNHGTKPYLDVLAEFNDMISQSKVELIVGLAAYKVGATDAYAGNGKNEWETYSDILSRQVTAARNESRYGGFALYRYDSLYHPSSAVSVMMKKERNSLKEIL